MLDGGWRYQEPPPGKGPVEIPLKDGTFDHIGDGFIYLFWVLHNEIWGGKVPGSKDPAEADAVETIKEKFMKKQAQRKFFNLPAGSVGGGRLI
jgi:hypothetical protein